MGCFDSVFIECIACKNRIELQSKGGDCSMRRFHSSNVPVVVAADINGDEVVCDKCDTRWKVVAEMPDRVSMRLVRTTADVEEWD